MTKIRTGGSAVDAGVEVLEPAVEPAKPLGAVDLVAPLGRAGPKSTSCTLVAPNPRIPPWFQGPRMSRCGDRLRSARTAYCPATSAGNGSYQPLEKTAGMSANRCEVGGLVGALLSPQNPV